MSIILCSQSLIKIAAVEEVYPSVQIHPIQTTTLIEQPFGIPEITTCLTERMNEGFPIAIKEKIKIVLAIENGIIKDGSKFFDICMCGYKPIIEAGFIKTSSTDHWVEFPKDAVEEAIRRGLRTTTVGEVLAEMYPGLDPKDPHTYLTGGRVTRKKQIVETLKCLGRLPLQ